MKRKSVKENLLIISLLTVVACSPNTNVSNTNPNNSINNISSNSNGNNISSGSQSELKGKVSFLTSKDIIYQKESGSRDGTLNEARFFQPNGLVTDNNGNLYVADASNNRIRKISFDGKVSTLAGSGEPGRSDGSGNNTTFYNPAGIVVDSSNNIIVSDFTNNKIRKISPAGVVTTLAGNGEPGTDNGIGNKVKFYNPLGLAIDKNDNIYISDYSSHLIRKMSSKGEVTTLAGSGKTGNLDKKSLEAEFDYPSVIAQ